MHLETFHKFWEKVNEIQKNFLREKYESIVLNVITAQSVTTQTDDHRQQDDTDETFTEPLDSICPTTSSVGEYFIEISADLKDDGPNYLMKFVPEPMEPSLIPPTSPLSGEQNEEIPVAMITRSKGRGPGRPKLKPGKEESVAISPIKIKIEQEPPVALESSSLIASDRDSEDEDASGESENEFPARDSDNEEWPAKETLDKFPQRIIKNGLLTVKGKKLMAMINKWVEHF